MHEKWVFEARKILKTSFDNIDSVFITNLPYGVYQLFCGEPAISLHSYHVSLVQWTTRLLPVTRDPGSNPLGGTCETGILLFALSHYIGDPDMIDHCGLV